MKSSVCKKLKYDNDNPFGEMLDVQPAYLMVSPSPRCERVPDRAGHVCSPVPQHPGLLQVHLQPGLRAGGGWQALLP